MVSSGVFTASESFPSITPALLKSTESDPKRRSAAATIASASVSFDTFAAKPSATPAP